MSVGGVPGQLMFRHSCELDVTGVASLTFLGDDLAANILLSVSYSLPAVLGHDP